MKCRVFINRLRTVSRILVFLSAALLLPWWASAPARCQESPLLSITIEERPREISIDGNISEWNFAAPLELNSNKMARGASWGGPDDLSARIWLAWDDTALYFAVDLRDDDFFGCPPGRQVWSADAFIMALRFPTSAEKDKVFFVILSEENGKPTGAGLCGSGSRYSAQPLPSLELASYPKEDQAPFLEGRLEWCDLLGDGCRPPERMEANFEARDLDARGRIKSLSWVPSNGNGGSEPSFGLAVLMRDSRLRDMMPRRNVDFVEFVELVYLPVVVTDGTGEYVMNLSESSFQIMEDGVEQRVDSLRFETRPITVGLLIDKSGSMEHHIEVAKDAAARFLEGLRSEDRCYAVAFNHNIELLKDLEGDTPEAIKAIKEIDASGGTLLYATVRFALDKLRYLREKKVLILLSDGKDESQGYNPYGEIIDFQSILEEAKRQEVVVYPVAFRLNDTKSLNELMTLARETGGRLFTPYSTDQLLDSYNEIARELKSQYLLSYVSNNRTWDGRWRRIEVRVKGKNYNVRSRPGYYAPLR
jgi:Ca-activated chloride channel family protein